MLLKKQMKSEPLDQSRNGLGSPDCSSISQRHDQYFENITDISNAGNSSPLAREIHSQYFDEISAIFPILYRFLDQQTIVLVPADINDFLFLDGHQF